jgi:hypothetical protein
METETTKDYYEFFNVNGVYAFGWSVPQTHTVSKMVYFVSGAHGDEYGQFDNEKEALKKAEFMSNVPVDQRRMYDQ